MFMNYFPKCLNFYRWLAAAFILTMISIGAAAQGQAPPAAQKAPEPIPLTADELKLDLKKMLADQPAFMATENFSFSEGFGGFSAAQKVAGRDNFYRLDTGMVTVISESKKPNLRIYGNKTYERELGDRKPSITPSRSMDPKELLMFDDLSLTALNSLAVDGHKWLRVEAKSAALRPKVFIYFDRDEKDIVAAYQVIDERQGSQARRVNISFDVPKDYFDIPAGYRELPKYKWTRVTGATVVSGKDVVKDAVVFRQGDFLFAHIGEFEDYLVDLKKAAAGTAFQGLVVDSSGRYIWRTDAAEGSSSGELGVGRSDCKSCPPLIITPNSVTFPSSRYENRKTLVKITW
jgi:hypothetical protein